MNIILCVQLLFKYGAKDDINALDETGNTPLNSCIHMDAKLIALFIENGANIFIFNKEGETLLHGACKWQSLSAVKFLVEQGLQKYIHKGDSDGGTPLLYLVFCYNGAQSDTIPIFNYLVECGSDLYRHFHDGETVLHNIMRATYGTKLFQLILEPQLMAQVN